MRNRIRLRWRKREIDKSSMVDGFQLNGHEGTDRKATWHLHGLSGLQETLNRNVLPPTINLNQRNLYMGRISQNTCIYEDLPHKETSSLLRNKSRFYTTIKTQKL